MKAKLFQGKTLVKRSRIHGFGVFAQKKFKRGELVEEVCCLIFKNDEDTLSDYAFTFSRAKSMVLTGNGCLYNHAEDYNLNHEVDTENRIVRFKARRDIKKGEELLIDYGKDWFQSRDRKLK